MEKIKLKAGWTKEKVMAQIKKYNNGTRASTGHTAGSCLYKTPNGNRCAIGCFIPTDHPALNHKGGVRGLLGDYPELRNYMPFEHDDDLHRFQSAHDCSEDAAAEGKPHPVYTSIKRFLDEKVE